MSVPVAYGAGQQAVWADDKNKDGCVSWKRLYGVIMYVPLTDAYE